MPRCVGRYYGGVSSLPEALLNIYSTPFSIYLLFHSAYMSLLIDY